MTIEQTIAKLQAIINDTLPTLELFVDGNIQASSNDCVNLQKQLNDLQEYLSVYKHLKTNKELSPSFGLHSKLSEVIVNEDSVKAGIKSQEEPVKETSSSTGFNDQTAEEPSSKKLEITLNQKFQFINDLFQQNATEFGHALDQLNNCKNWQDAETYLLSLKSVYGWKDNHDGYKLFVSISKKRFV